MEHSHGLSKYVGSYLAKEVNNKLKVLSSTQECIERKENECYRMYVHFYWFRCKDFGKRKILGLMEKLSVLILELKESNEIVNIILDQRYLKVNESDFSYGDVLTPSLLIRGYSDPTFWRNLRRWKVVRRTCFTLKPGPWSFNLITIIRVYLGKKTTVGMFDKEKIL